MSDDDDDDDDSSDCSDDESMYFEDEVPLDDEYDRVEAQPQPGIGSSHADVVGPISPTSLRSTITADPQAKEHCGGATFVSLGLSQQETMNGHFPYLKNSTNVMNTKSKRYEYEQQILAAWR
jgi:hypothetical protein